MSEATMSGALQVPVRRGRVPIGALLSGVWLVVIVVLIVAGDLLAPYPPAAQDLALSVSSSSPAHWLGTDNLGRDIVSRMIAGARTAVIGPLIVAVLTEIIATLAGLWASYRGGLVDKIMSRLSEIIYTLPSMLVIIVLVGVSGGGYVFLIVALTLLCVPISFRLIRSRAIVEARLSYVDAAKTLGIGNVRIVVQHILPNIAPTVIANFLLTFVGSLVGFASLSFLGFGAAVSSPDWGRMISENRAFLDINPYASIGPAVMIMLTAAAATIVCDWLYDRTRRSAR